MTEEKVVLVTGVASYWGRRVATRLMEEPGLAIIGLDDERPDPEIPGLGFIQADVRNPLLVDLFESEQVDTVCHLAFVETTRPSESAFDLNVMGTMKIFSACTQAGVRKIVFKSSTAVYGAHPSNSAFLAEDHALRGNRSYGIARDLVEIESFCNDFRRQTPEIILTTLRFASIVGLKADTPMTRLLSGPWAPVLLGFDPRMQLIHEDDVVEALAYAVINDVPGVFNVAAEEIFPLMKIMSLSATLPIPILHPLAYWGINLLEGIGSRLTNYVPIDLDYIRYPWVADLNKMQEELGYSPTYTVEEILREFASQKRLSRYSPESAALGYDEERLRAIIAHRSRARERQAADTPDESATLCAEEEEYDD